MTVNKENVIQFLIDFYQEVKAKEADLASRFTQAQFDALNEDGIFIQVQGERLAYRSDEDGHFYLYERAERNWSQFFNRLIAVETALLGLESNDSEVAYALEGQIVTKYADVLPFTDEEIGVTIFEKDGSLCFGTDEEIADDDYSEFTAMGFDAESTISSLQKIEFELMVKQLTAPQ